MTFDEFKAILKDFDTTTVPPHIQDPERFLFMKYRDAVEARRYCVPQVDIEPMPILTRYVTADGYIEVLAKEVEARKKKEAQRGVQEAEAHPTVTPTTHRKPDARKEALRRARLEKIEKAEVAPSLPKNQSPEELYRDELARWKARPSRTTTTIQ